MKSAVWTITTVIVLGGCSTVQEPILLPATPLKPFPLAAETNATDPVPNAPYCATTFPQDLDVELPEETVKVSDLERFVQSLSPYVEANGVDREELLEVQTRFEGSYFTPWNNCTPPMSAEDVAWPLRAFKGGYGSNLRPVTPEWFQEMQIQSNFDAYGTLNQKGISVKYMDIRALPSDKPLYKNPALPGEGYPFDLLQNSSVNYAEPVFISHTSKDGAWSYIFTNSVSGWVKSEGIALLDDQTAGEYMSREKLFVMEDNLPLYDDKYRFTTYSRIGMVLALEREEGENYHALAFENNGSSKRLIIPKKTARIGVGKLIRGDLTRIGEQMLKNTYGWGGMFGERDCSSMIRDMYTPFGIWLPRNSSAQSRKGEIVSFEGLPNETKLSLIKEKGVPFETIIYLKGHVVLYIGTYQDNVLILHNIWGIRTLDKQGVKGRHIVGKAVISTLEFGSELENFDPNNKLLTRVQSMNVFTRQPLLLSSGKKEKNGKKGKSL